MELISTAVTSSCRSIVRFAPRFKVTTASEIEPATSGRVGFMRTMKGPVCVLVWYALMASGDLGSFTNIRATEPSGSS